MKTTKRIFLFAFSVALFATHNLNAQVTIGAETAPKSHSLLELNTSEVKAGLRLPQLTTKERDALNVDGDDSAKGLTIFNIETNCMETWSGTTWLSNCGQSLVEQPPLIIIEPRSQYITKANWNNATIATLNVTATGEQVKYQWFKWDNATSTYAEINGATDAIYTPNAASFLPDSYYCRVYNDYGIIDSQKVTVIKACQANGNGNRIFQFMCHNLGADESKDPFTPDAAIHGGKYKWGLAVRQNGGGVGIDQATDQANTGTISNWSSLGTPPATDAPWNMTTQNPCPAGWRLPTKEEWDQVINTANNPRIERVPAATVTWTSSATNYATGLKIGEALFLPTAGYRSPTGALDVRGIYGYYWSSTQLNTYGYYMGFSSTGQSTTHTNRSYGFPIRCVAE